MRNSHEERTQQASDSTQTGHWALSPGVAALFGLLAGLFVFLNHLPLRNALLWGHLLHGRWMLESRRLPAEEPFQPLAEGMPVVDGNWLSQTLLALVERQGGVEWLSHLFAIITILICLLLGHAIFLRSRSVLCATAGVVAMILLGWSELAHLGPQTFGLLCFTLLAWLIASSGSIGGRRWLWLGVFACMSLWANLHSSFIVGLLLLGCWTLGCALDLFRRQGSLLAPWRSTQMRRRVYVLEFAAVATLLNPYGVKLWLNLFTSSGNENLRLAAERQPLVNTSVTGIAFVCSMMVLVFVVRHSRRRIRSSDTLLLAACAVAGLCQVRFVIWYAAAYGLVLAPYWAGLLRQASGERRPAELTSGLRWYNRASPRYAILSVFVVWLAFSLAPVSRGVLGGKPRTPQQLYGVNTPIELTQYLRDQAPQGQVFHPHGWGSWIIWDGPVGIQAFTTEDPSRTPRRVWQDYEHVASAQPGWQRLLDRYHVTTLIVDKQQQPGLARAIRRTQDWRLSHDDEQSLVFLRSSIKTPQPADDHTVALASAGTP